MNYTSTVTSKGTITLPAAFRRRHNMTSGSKVTIVERADGLYIEAPIDLEQLRAKTRRLLNVDRLKAPTKQEIEQSKTEDYRNKYMKSL